MQRNKILSYTFVFFARWLCPPPLICTKATFGQQSNKLTYKLEREPDIHQIPSHRRLRCVPSLQLMWSEQLLYDKSTLDHGRDDHYSQAACFECFSSRVQVVYTPNVIVALVIQSGCCVDEHFFLFLTPAESDCHDLCCILFPILLRFVSDPVDPSNFTGNPPLCHALTTVGRPQRPLTVSDGVAESTRLWEPISYRSYFRYISWSLPIDWMSRWLLHELESCILG